MKTRPVSFGGSRRIVVKIGSAVLRAGPDFDRVTFVALVRDIVAIKALGIEVVVVCSGAVAIGMSLLGLKDRPTKTAQLQAVAAIGQGRLMRFWADELAHYELVPAQVLLTQDDLQDRKRFLSARHTLRAVLSLGGVPIINENDTVAIDEIKMGDNDLLSSQIVSLVEGGALIILSDVDGYYDRNPADPDAMVVPWVTEITADVLATAGGSTSTIGSGGMRTKVEGARQVNQLGVPAIIAFGKRHGVLQALAAGQELGTWFAPAPSTVGSRKHWIAYALRHAGEVHVDAGAMDALLADGGSLLAVGVTRIDGEFGVGDAVRILGPKGQEFARGLVSFSSAAFLARQGAMVLVHRDDLAIATTL